MQMILQFRGRLLARARVCLLACLLFRKRLACLIREQTQVKRGKTRERERELILVPLRFCYFSTFLLLLLLAVSSALSVIQFKCNSKFCR